MKGHQLIRSPWGRSFAARLRSGDDVVEIAAPFASNQANALVDVLTPELVESITRMMIHGKGVKGFTPRRPGSDPEARLRVAGSSGRRRRNWQVGD